MPFCPYCGQQLDADMRFCPACGKEQGAVPAAAEEIAAVNPAVVSPYTQPVYTQPTFTDQLFAAGNTAVGADYRVILLARGNSTKKAAMELLQDLMGYSATESRKLVENAPIEVACALTLQQAMCLAQTLTEYGMQVTVCNSVGYVDMSQYAASSVFGANGSMLQGALNILATLSLANRVRSFYTWSRPDPFRFAFMPRYHRPIAPPRYTRPPRRAPAPPPAPRRAAPPPAPRRNPPASGGSRGPGGGNRGPGGGSRGPGGGSRGPGGRGPGR